MRKFILSLLLLLLPVGAMAQQAAAVQAYDWASLGTVAGASAATLMIVQMIKAPLDRLWKLPTRLVAYGVAFLLLLLAQHFSNGLTAEGVLLAAVNAVIAALSAYGSYELTFAK